MKKTILISTLFLSLGTLFSACSNASIVEAPNGKKYYIDNAYCERYTLERDRLYCYDTNDNRLKKSYMPVEFGYSIDTRTSYF